MYKKVSAQDRLELYLPAHVAPSGTSIKCLRIWPGLKCTSVKARS